jgi:large subunit ribosomal protein L10
MKKAEKPIFVENLTAELKTAKSVVLINFAGMTVKSQQELKKRLKEAGASLVVVKNTLLKRAAEAAKIDKEALNDTILTGQTALVIANDDAVSPISVLGKFAKEFEVPSMKVGIIDGAFYNSEALQKVSNLPSRDALLSQVLGALMAPEYGLVGTLQGNIQKLLFMLSQKAKS